MSRSAFTSTARSLSLSLSRKPVAVTPIPPKSGLSRVAASSARFHSACKNMSLNPSFDDNSYSSGPASGSGTGSGSGSGSVSAAILRYCKLHSSPLPSKFDDLHATTIERFPDMAQKTVSDTQGHFQLLLMRMTRPKRVLELGCFLGYSAMAMADGMPTDGVLYTCEKDPEAAQLARQLFETHGYSDGQKKNAQPTRSATIELLEGDAMASLETLAKNQLQFDAIFIDADKSGYIKYFDHILNNDMLSENGYILADNTLFSGLVLNSARSRSEAQSLQSPPPTPNNANGVDNNAQTSKQLRQYQKYANHVDAFNLHVQQDPRVDVVILPVFDGLSVIMRKKTS
ncbi:hypothetical protein BG004_006118 [Podila humilis]|nr:hypothetical protein BG004_006118 [Podila humilis]